MREFEKNNNNLNEPLTVFSCIVTGILTKTKIYLKN